MTDFNVTVNTRDETDPAAQDWPTKQTRAVIPFQVVSGLPINPLVSAAELEALPQGRGELWHWGEAVAVDAVVMHIRDGVRHLLMVERRDGHGWALPGGGLDAGETPSAGVARELAEETGLELSPDRFVMQAGRGVPDPRQGRNAWMVTIPGIALLLDRPLPEVTGLDDAATAAWIPATNYPALHAALAVRGGVVFPAHRDMLRDFLTTHD